ncbi:MAG: PAS domain S-box protein, partial [Gemmatimonadota bacterium]|nr:PAS domain S-box protein [Gemmatimonadota bacterium]
MHPAPQHHDDDAVEHSRHPGKLRDGRLHELELALHRRGAILAAVGFAAEQFLGNRDWEASVRDVLDRLGSGAEASRVDLLQLDRDRENVVRSDLRCLWIAPTAPAAVRVKHAMLDDADLAHWRDVLARAQAIEGPITSLPPSERDSLALHEVRALAVLPVFDAEECWGALRFFDCVRADRWDGLAVEALKAAARALGAALSRRRADEALRKSEERFRQLSALTTEGIVIHEYGKIEDANPSLARMFGYELSDVVDRTVLDFVPEPADRELVMRNMLSAYDKPYEIVARRRDGSHIAIEVIGHSTVYQGRSVRVATLRDITERKQMEAKAHQLVREQAARAAAEAAEQRAAFLGEASRILGTSFDYHTTLEQLPRLGVPSLADCCVVDMFEGGEGFVRVGVAHRDPEKELLLRQETHFSSGVKFTKHPVGRVLRKGESVLMSEIPDELVRQSATSPAHLELLMKIAPRSLISVPLTTTGKVVGVLSLVTSESGRRYDSNDLAMAEELARRASLSIENARLYEEAQRATKLREEILAVVAHDLRNPINTISMSCSLLLDTPARQIAGPSHKTLQIIRRASERMNRLVQDLLDIQRIESGQLAVAPRPESLGGIVREALDMLRPLADAKGLELTLEAPDDLPRGMADPLRIQQVLSNLIGNAIKHTQRGRITTRVSLVDSRLQVAVIDTG